MLRTLGENLPALPVNDAQARELAPLLDQPEALREAWAEVVDLHPEPTAAKQNGQAGPGNTTASPSSPPRSSRPPEEVQGGLDHKRCYASRSVRSILGT